MTVAFTVVVWWVGYSFSQHQIATNILLSVTSLAVGALIFLADGVGRVTPIGLFNYATALIMGYGGLALTVDPSLIQSNFPQHLLSLVLLGTVLCQTFIGMLSRRSGSANIVADLRLSKRASSALILLGASLLIVVLVTQQLTVNVAELVDGIAFASVAIMALGVTLSRKGCKSPIGLILMVAPFLVYATLIHGGSGRLRIVGLACTIIVILTMRYRRWVKLAMALGTLPALWWLSTSRLATQGRLTDHGVGWSQGLDSMLASTAVFADLIAHLGPNEAVGFGTSFLTFLFVMVPDSVRPDWMPEGLGYELVSIAAPEKYGSNFSTVSSVYGEFWWNFSWFGLILAVPALVWLLRILDRGFLAASSAAAAGNLLSLPVLIGLAMLIGNLGDLVWSGSHTWLTRMYARAIPLALLALLTVLMRQRSSTPLPKPRASRSYGKTG